MLAKMPTSLKKKLKLLEYLSTFALQKHAMGPWKDIGMQARRHFSKTPVFFPTHVSQPTCTTYLC